MVRALAGCAIALALAATFPGTARGSEASEATAAVALAIPEDVEAAAAGGRDLPGTGVRAPAVTLVLEADLATQRLTVREGDLVVHVWPISTGRRGYGTPTGTFRPAWMAKSWYSRKYDNAPMPHAVFFNGGIAFHGTTVLSMLGRPASHGCVRLAPDNARQLYQLVRAHGMPHTKVVVHGVPKFEGRTVVAGKGKAPGGTASARAKGRLPAPGQPVATWQWSFFE
jgi:hypothetical protein